jgi:hypothetical protein
MITINLGKHEYYDSESNQFIYEDGGIVRFEYSLKVLYDWEGKWRKPFLKGGLTDNEWFDFCMMMAIDPIDEKFMTNDVIEILSKYVEDSNTATVFNSTQQSQNGNNMSSKGKFYTSEEIYALMVTANVPMEFETRNLNRLLTILKIISSHNSPPKKMSKQDIYKYNTNLNAQRKAKMNSKG